MAEPLQTRTRLVYQHPGYQDLLIEVEEAEPLPPGPAAAMLQRGASSFSSVCTLCNTAIGSGVLALPYAFYCTGLVGCLLLYAVVAVLEAFTMYVLAKMAERYDNARSYGSLVRRALGRKTGGLLAAVTIIYLWGSSVSYLIIAADTFTNISALHLGPDALTSQRHVILGVVGLLVLVMSFPRELKALDRVSAAAVLGFIYTAVALMIRGIQAVKARPDPWSGVELFKFDWHALYAVSIVVFGLNCHANVNGVFHELDHRPDRIISQLPASPQHFHSLGWSFAPRPYTHKLIGMLGTIIVYMSIILTGYVCVGVSGYLAFPTDVSSNILNSFSSKDVLIQVARAVIGCVVVGSYPLNHHPGRLAFEDLVDATLNIRPTPAWACNTFTVCFVTSTVAVAMLVQDLGVVVHWVGGTVAAFMIFTLPGVLLINASIIKASMIKEDRAGLQEEEAGAAAAAAADEQAAAGAGSSIRSSLLAPSWSAAQVGKKAGIREAGLIFAPGKSWIAGVCLVIISVLVLAVTVATT